MGSSVLFAKYYAIKDEDELSKSISTAFILIGEIALGITLITSVFINPILQLFQIPDSAFNYARDYLLIVLSGLFFLAIYQVSTAILRAFGDSKTPLYYLIVSTSINVVFDFVFVIYTPLGGKGPALSTFLAHFVTFIPILVHLYKRVKHLPLAFKVDQVMLKEVSALSILTSVQQSIMNFGILLVQGLVNAFGVVAMAAFTIGVRIDAFAYMPAQDFANGFSIYVSQNLGVKRYDRIQKGFHSAALTSNGRLFIWGRNDNGQLGDGTTTNRSTPTEITSRFSLATGDKSIQVSLGGYHSAALTSNGRLFTWGRNNNGQLGDGTNTNRYSPTQITQAHYELLHSDTVIYNQSIMEYVPLRDGYTFSGWYSDIYLNTTYIFGSMPAEDITLYAKWVSND
jgi:uncharacterized repeat protein (TIGR02543 family)